MIGNVSMAPDPDRPKDDVTLPCRHAQGYGCLHEVILLLKMWHSVAPCHRETRRRVGARHLHIGLQNIDASPKWLTLSIPLDSPRVSPAMSRDLSSDDVTVEVLRLSASYTASVFAWVFPALQLQSCL